MDIENKMLVDNYWLDYEDMNQDEDEDFYIRTDMEYDDEIDERLSFYAWSRENDGYHF